MRRHFLIPIVVASSLALGVGCERREEPTGSTRTTSATTSPPTTSTGTPVTEARPALSAEDKDFLNSAAQGGVMEVALGKMAKEKAVSAKVKAFGDRMVIDHSKANDDLRRLAANKGFTLPTEWKSDQKSDSDKLSKLSGAAFDREYMSLMVKDHQKDVDEFQKSSTDAKDPDIRSFAGKVLPTLQEHLRMAKDIEGKPESDVKAKAR